MKVMLNWKLVCSARKLDDHLRYLKENGGIYLWIWNGNPRRIVYIGETGNFSDRLFDHFRNIFSGNYTYFKTMTDKNDFVNFVKKHYAGKSLGEIKQKKHVYVPYDICFSDFLLEKKELINRHQYLHGMDFAFAEMEPLHMDKYRKEIEGGLILNLWDSYHRIAYDTSIGDDDRLNRSDARSNQKLIGNINKYPTTDFEIEHTGSIKCIPQELLEIKRLSCS